MTIRGVIAMIDDDDRVREAVASLLIARGFEVELYCSVEAFLEERGYLMIDCVISDIGLPGKTGRDLANWIEQSWPSLPLILVSGQEELVPIESAPRRTVLAKPFAAGQLVAAIDRVTTHA